MSHFREGEKVYGLTRIFNLVIKLFIICSSNCTSCSERSCPWINIRLYVCNSNHYVFLYYSKKILVNVYISCCNSWLYICKIYYSKRLFTSFFIRFLYYSCREIAFVCFELFLLYKIVRMLPTIRRKYKKI